MGAPTAVGTARFSTAAVTAGDRVRRWEAWNATALLGLHAEPPPGTGLDASQTAHRLPDARVARVRASPHRVERGVADVAARPAGGVAVFLPLGPASRLTTGPTTTLRRGQLVLLDADRPFRREFPDGVEELVVAVPGPVTGGLPDPVVFELGGPRASTAATALARDLTAGPDATWRRAVRVRAVVRAAAGDDAPPDRFELAQAFVAHHQTDPALSAASIAAALGISERQVSRAFAAAGTSVPAAVLEHRLQAARALLEAAPGTSPAVVARRVGIASASHFHRRFVARFGTTPGRWRSG